MSYYPPYNPPLFHGMLSACSGVVVAYVRRAAWAYAKARKAKMQKMLKIEK